MDAAFLEVLADAGVDLISPITSYPDYLLRLLQLQAIMFLLGFGLRFFFRLSSEFIRGQFF